jgi:hypothetical protein
MIGSISEDLTCPQTAPSSIVKIELFETKLWTSRHLDISTSTSRKTAIMSAINKIAQTSPSHSKPSELELSIAGALYDLETNTSDLKAALRPLQFVNAKEVSN